MAQRHPDRAGAAVDLAVDDLPQRRMHRRLGDAIHVDQARRSRMVAQPRPRRSAGSSASPPNTTVSASADLPARVLAHQRFAAHKTPTGSGLSTLTCSATSKAWKSSGERDHRLGHHHQPPTVQQRTEDLPHREVEGQRMTLRPHLPRRQSRSASSDSNSWVTLWWVMATPLGTPVVPEV